MGVPRNLARFHYLGRSIRAVLFRPYCNSVIHLPKYSTVMQIARHPVFVEILEEEESVVRQFTHSLVARFSLQL